jgi:hypothetical protein
VAACIVKIEHAGMSTAEDREHLLAAFSDKPVIVVAAQVSQEWDQIHLRILYDDHKFAQRFRAPGCNLFVCSGCHETN